MSFLSRVIVRTSIFRLSVERKGKPRNFVRVFARGTFSGNLEHHAMKAQTIEHRPRCE